MPAHSITPGQRSWTTITNGSMQALQKKRRSRHDTFTSTREIHRPLQPLAAAAAIPAVADSVAGVGHGVLHAVVTFLDQLEAGPAPRPDDSYQLAQDEVRAVLPAGTGESLHLPLLRLRDASFGPWAPTPRRRRLKRRRFGGCTGRRMSDRPTSAGASGS